MHSSHFKNSSAGETPVMAWGTVGYFRRNCDSFVANVPGSLLLTFKECLKVCTNLSASLLVAVWLGDSSDVRDHWQTKTAGSKLSPIVRDQLLGQAITYRVRNTSIVFSAEIVAVGMTSNHLVSVSTITKNHKGTSIVCMNSLPCPGGLRLRMQSHS